MTKLPVDQLLRERDAEQLGRWNLRFAQAGSYAIEVYVNPPHNVAQRVRYLIRAQGREERVVVRQTGARRLRVAVRDFAAGGDQKVEVFDNGDEQGRDLHITVDALRVVRMDTPPPPRPDAGSPRDTGAPPVDTGPPAPAPDSGVTPVDAGPAEPDAAPAADVQQPVDSGRGDVEPLDPDWGTPRARAVAAGWARPVVACLGQLGRFASASSLAIPKPALGPWRRTCDVRSSEGAGMRGLGILLHLVVSSVAVAGGYDTPMLYAGEHMGLGGAAVAGVDDPSALFHNPAGLAQVRRQSPLSHHLSKR